MSRHKPPGRFCWCCGRRRPNERFSQKRGVCRDCASLGREEIAYRQHVRDINRLLTWEGTVRRTQRRTFEKYLAHPDARVRAYAERVKAHEERERQAWAALRAEEAAAQAEWLAIEETDTLPDDERKDLDRDEEGALPPPPAVIGAGVDSPPNPSLTSSGLSGALGSCNFAGLAATGAEKA